MSELNNPLDKDADVAGSGGPGSPDLMARQLISFLKTIRISVKAIREVSDDEATRMFASAICTSIDGAIGTAEEVLDAQARLTEAP